MLNTHLNELGLQYIHSHRAPLKAGGPVANSWPSRFTIPSCSADDRRLGPTDTPG
jgi:hypothetical protein